VGHLVVPYHSTPTGAPGITRIVGEVNPDDPRWDLVTLAPKRRLRFVPLPTLRELPELVDCPLLARGNRLSVMPLTAGEFAAIAAAGGVKG
jgi:predicted RNA-binding protein with PUA-like domain